MMKLRDEIFKLIYRLTHSKRYKHNRKRWPYVKISRGIFGQIVNFSYKGKNIPIIDLKSLENSCEGKLVIIASGPSIKQINFKHSPLVPTLGVNGSYCLKNKVNFNFYVITDIHFFSQRPDIVKQIISDKELLLFLQVDGLVKIINLFGFKAISCRISLIEDAFKLTYEPIKTLSEIKNDPKRNSSIYFYTNNNKEHEPLAFETNITHGVFPAKTVVYWTLQIAAYLGFKQLYLAGVDLNNFHLPRFYETSDNVTYSQLELDFEKNIFPAFEHASCVMKKLNINVKNMSLNSALGSCIFDKQAYDDIF
jgi:Kdo-III transferase WaaZ